MILCVTPNPAVDRTYVAPGYADGGVFRPQATLIQAGGKGPNVARAIATFGGFPMQAGFLAGHSGHLFAEMVEAESIPAKWTWLESGDTRTCTALADPEIGKTTIVNEYGPLAGEAEWKRLRKDVREAAADCEFVAVCGSLSSGSPPYCFADLLRELRDAGKQVWVDSSSAGLQAAIETSGCAIKVNEDEIGAILARTISSIAEAAEAAETLRQQINAPVAVTLGSKGAVLAADAGCWYARPPAIQVVSAIGSGDCFLAGLLVGFVRGHLPSKALRQAAAVGAANALSIGAARFTWAQFEEMWEQTQVEPVTV
jgi:1-phosphofructokinase family hexose kinase